MNIDFTKLAKIAHQNERKETSTFLIGYEQSIVKKIPFLLEIDQQEKALGFAMESGDPNIIEKVFSEILKKYRGGSYFDMLEMVNKIEDCIRNLRNYAKKMRDYTLLDQILDFQAKK
jgi:hypothetical protein